MSSSGEPTGFLYPFIESEERDATTLLADLAASARGKIAVSQELRAATLGCRSGGSGRRSGDGGPVRAGGRLFAFGNGGSATDAEGTVECSGARQPGGRCRPCPWSRTGPCSPPWPTTSASNWSSPRQLIAHGRRRRHRGRVLDQRRLGQRAAGLR